MINVAILGYGTVGSGVFEVLNENKESISRRAGQELHVKYVLDLRDFPGQPVEKVLVHDYEQIVSDPEVDIVVEVMGGVEPAYTFVKKALLAGKNVCTSNKALVAKHGRELMDIAKEKSINFLFEASCGGGIPIIRVINSSLTGDEIDEVTGILNGTTNYILTEMAEKGSDFADVLKEAQNLGYAERNPEADVCLPPTWKDTMHAVRSQSFPLLLMRDILILKIFIQRELQRSHLKIWSMLRSLAEPSNFLEPAADWQTEPVMQW